MTRRMLLLSALLTAIGCSNRNDVCGGSDTAAPSTKAVTPELDRSDVTPLDLAAVPKASIDAAISANNEFTFDLYRQLVADAGTKNFFTSPLSASVALTMTYFGAAGQTATEMASVLHLSDDPKTIADGQGALARTLSSRGTTALSVAGCGATSSYQLELVNSLWGERTYAWEKPFLDIMAGDYDAGIATEDFIGAPTHALQAINDWVSAKTNGAIADLLPPAAIDAKTRIVLVDAIHLKLPWATNFDPVKTAPAPFTRADQSMVSTPFMNITSNFPYDSENDAQIVGLPLSGKQVYFVATLPPPGVDLATYEASLISSSKAFKVPSSGFDIQLSIPRIGFTSPTFSLAAALGTLGMHAAFDANRADFSGMCSNPPDHAHLSIQDVFQKAIVEMKETGVEAAAVTAVESCGNCAAAPAAPPLVVFNRPYLVSIVDQPTGAILFIGHVEDPTDPGMP